MDKGPVITRTRPPFGGHEKFTFRHGWLKKGLDAIKGDPLIFSRDDAFIKLGVGKNMAASIRYWGLALGLYHQPDRKSSALRPTALGQALLDDHGWDPYLEDIGSLWLLHWQLASNQEKGLVFHLIFSRYYDIEFRKAGLVEFLKVKLMERGFETTEGMIQREIDVFLRTYLPAQSRSEHRGEESLDCPLVDLNLISLSPGDGFYRFDIGTKPSLPAAVVGYGLLAFLNEKLERQRTITVDDCVYSPGSPGQIFKLDENSLMNYLEKLEQLTGGELRVQETAGLRQIYLDSTSLRNLAEGLLREYYA